MKYLLVDIVLFLCFYSVAFFIRRQTYSFVKATCADYERNDLLMIVLSLLLLLYNIASYCKERFMPSGIKTLPRGSLQM